MAGPKIQLRLLGAFAATVDGEDATGVLAQPKRLALLAWLALNRPLGLHRRDTLCALLWPESPDEKARATLRTLLSVLRRDLSEHALVTEGHLVGINPRVVLSDAGRVLDALDAGDDATAVSAYSGELLPGLHLSEGEAFDRWFEQLRRDLRRRVAEAAWRLVELADAAGEVSEARRRAERALAIDPEDEAGLRYLLILQAKDGDRAAALRTHEAFARYLKEDWGSEPEAATEQLVEQIRAGTVNGERGRKSAEPAALQQVIINDAAAASIPTSVEDPHVATRPNRAKRGLPWLLASGLVGVVLLAGSRLGRVDRNLVPNRVLVVPFANHTGDPSLDALGLVASDWVIQALQRSGFAEVVDPPTAYLTTRDLPDRAPETIAAVREFARGPRAGYVVAGAVAKVGDSVEYSGRLVDARNSRVIRVIDPVRAPISDPSIALDEVRSRLTGAIASEIELPVIPLAPGDRPPRLEAYREFVAGLDRFMLSDYVGAIPRFRNAVARDTTFTLARIWLTYALGNEGFEDSSRLVLRQVREGMDRLTPSVQAWLDIDSLEQSLAPADRIEAAYRRAIHLSPGSHNEWNYALHLIYEGRLREGIAILKRFDVDKSWFTRWDYYWYTYIEALHYAGDYRSALAAARTARRRLGKVPLPYELQALAALGDVAAVRKHIDSLLQVKGSSPFYATFVAAHELDAHGHPAAALDLLERSEPWLRGRFADDTTAEIRINHAIVQASLAFLRGDRSLAAVARATLEPVLFWPDTWLTRNARLFGYLPAVCAEGDSARVARLPDPLPGQLWDYEASGILLCQGKQEPAMRVLEKQPAAWYAHVMLTLRPLRNDPRFQQWLRPRG